MTRTTADVVGYLTNLQAHVARVEGFVSGEATAAVTQTIQALPKQQRAMVTSDIVTRALGNKAPHLFGPIADVVALNESRCFIDGHGTLSEAIGGLINSVRDGEYGHYARATVAEFMTEFHGAGGGARTLGIDLRPQAGNCTFATEMVAKPYRETFQAVPGAVYSFRFDHPDEPKTYSDVIVGKLPDGDWVISGEALARRGNGDDFPQRLLIEASLTSLEMAERAVSAYIATLKPPSAAMQGAAGQRAAGVARDYNEATSLRTALQTAIAEKRTQVAETAKAVAAHVAASMRPSTGWISPDVARVLTNLDTSGAAMPTATVSERRDIGTVHAHIREALVINDPEALRRAVCALHSEGTSLDPIAGSEIAPIVVTLTTASTSTTVGKDHVIGEMLRRLRLAQSGARDNSELLRVAAICAESDESVVGERALPIILSKLGWDIPLRDRRSEDKVSAYGGVKPSTLVDVITAAAMHVDRSANLQAISRALHHLRPSEIDETLAVRLEKARANLDGSAPRNSAPKWQHQSTASDIGDLLRHAKDFHAKR